MSQLAFFDAETLFDGKCIRFNGFDGKKEVTCGVTIVALKECDRSLQRYGLVPAEAFSASFQKFMIDIHDIARRKYERREFETEGDVQIMVHRHDLSP